MKSRNSIIRILPLVCLTTVSFWSGSAQADILYWDPNGVTTSPVFGPATGTWEGTGGSGGNSFWTTSSNGSFADGGRLSTTTADTLTVSPNAISTLTVSGAVSADNINLTNSGSNPLLTVSGGTSITLGTGASATAGIKTDGDGSASVSTPIILGSSVTFLNKGGNGGGTLTISGGITGTSALSLQGAKPLTISTADLNNTGTVINTSNNTVLISAKIGNAVTSVTQNGTSTMTLSGTNNGGSDFNGTFFITKGTLQFNSTAAFSGGAGDTINVAANGAVVLDGATNITPLLGVVTTASTGAIALNVNSSDAIDFNTAGLTAASLAASGSRTYSGTLTPQGTTYRLGGAVGTLTVSSATLTGANALSVVGTTADLSTVVLSGANDYTGNTTLSGGYLNVGVAENANVTGPLGKHLATAADTIVLNGGTLQYSAANQFDYSGRFSTAASQKYNVDTKAQTVTWASNLNSSGGTLSLNAPSNTANTGKLILTGTNEYTGVTTLGRYAGALSVATIGNGNVAGNLGKAPAAAANIVFNGREATSKLFYTGVSAITDRGFTIGGDATAIIDITSAATTLTFTGAATTGGSSGGIIKAGPGTLVLSGLSTRNAANGKNAVKEGTLQFGQAQAIFTNNPVNWTTSHLVVASGATLAFNVGGPGEVTTAHVTTLLTNLATSAANYAYTSGDVITGDGMNAGSFLGFDTTNASGSSFTIADTIANTTGAVGGARGLTKLGTNTLELTGTNSYTGTTTVSAGTLLVNGSNTGSGAVNVSSGATLGGTGAITGAVNVTGVLAPGASIQTLASGALSFANGSTFAFEMDSSVGLGVAADLQKVSGNLTLTTAPATTTSLTFNDLAITDTAFAGTTFSLINYTGTWNGGFFTFGGNELINNEEFTTGLNTWKIVYDAAEGGSNFIGEYAGGSDSFVNITAVPEPRAALLGGLGLLALLRRRRHA